MLSFEGADIIDTYQKSVRYVSFLKKKRASNYKGVYLQIEVDLSLQIEKRCWPWWECWDYFVCGSQLAACPNNSQSPPHENSAPP